jgi:hypothetical protein
MWPLKDTNRILKPEAKPHMRQLGRKRTGSGRVRSVEILKFWKRFITYKSSTHEIDDWKLETGKT